jgi:uncharacterized protein YkwD
MKKYLLFLILLCGCSSDGPVVFPPSPPPSPPSPIENKDDFVKQLLLLHNHERELKGRPGFVLDNYLVNYAQNHAKWMATKNKMQHSDISVLMSRYAFAGENIAWNQRNPQEVVDDWMHSPGHRANILNRNFTKVGFGKATAKDGSLYWCTVFGG